MPKSRTQFTFSLTGQDLINFIILRLNGIKNIETVRRGIKECLKECPEPTPEMIQKAKDLVK